MYLISAISTLLLLGTVTSAPTSSSSETRDLQRIYFKCDSHAASGFSPKCCTDIDGQVGINCLGAHIMGAVNPIYECNLCVYNITGCCQTTGYKNPYTNNTLDLCAMSIDPI